MFDFFKKIFGNKADEKTATPQPDVAINAESKIDTPTANQAETVKVEEKEVQPETEVSEPNETQPVEAPAESLSKEDADILKAKELMSDDNLFILLSVKEAFMSAGHSFPYIGNGGEGHLQLFLFHGYDKAKAFVDKTGFEVLDGVYCIGKMEPQSNYNTLANTLALAANMNINEVVLDGCQTCTIDWLLSVNNISKSAVNIRLTAEESKNLDKNFKPQFRFNPIDIYSYSNPYELNDSQANEVVKYFFDDPSKDSEEDAVYFGKLTLHKLCFLSTIIRVRFLPMSVEQKHENDTTLFNQKLVVLSNCITQKLQQLPCLYTLEDKETHQLLMRNNYMYVLYTDRYKYKGQFNYRTLKNGFSDVTTMWTQSLLTAGQTIKGIVVTDGPTVTAVVEFTKNQSKD